MNKLDFFDDNRSLYRSMYDDIKNAKNYVYLETYIFGNDKIGKKFRDLLIKRSKEIDVKILVDDLGSFLNKKFFGDFYDAANRIKYFHKIKFGFNIIKENNLRDHRKIIAIDDNISYVGSSNISEKSLDWREANLKMEGDIAKVFKQVFLKNFYIANKLLYRKKRHIRLLKYKTFRIVRDVPSLTHKMIRKRIISLVNNAKSEIMIENPYFLPDRKLRRRLIKTAKRGVSIKIILPLKSDVKIVDILRIKYLGSLYKKGIKIYFYKPAILHSKMMVVDNKYFSIGSANLDYRSNLYHFEMNLFGDDKKIISELRKHIKESLENSIEFNYQEWKKRSFIKIIMENILTIFRFWL